MVLKMSKSFVDDSEKVKKIVKNNLIDSSPFFL